MNTNSEETKVGEVRSAINTYLKAVKENDLVLLRSLFDPSANVAHYHVKKDAVVTNSLDSFIGVIESLHAKFSNAEERGETMNVRIVGHLASVELDFCFVMGENELRGTDLFNFAFQGGRWLIIHKSYWL